MLFMIFAACNIAEANETFIPWNFVVKEKADNPPTAEPFGMTSFLKSGLSLYSRYISPVDGDRCRMYPTCSAFSREAVEKYGFLGGALLTIDRLIHECNEQSRALQIIVGGRVRFLDTLNNNDFWWGRENAHRLSTSHLIRVR